MTTAAPDPTPVEGASPAHPSGASVEFQHVTKRYDPGTKGPAR